MYNFLKTKYSLQKTKKSLPKIKVKNNNSRKGEIMMHKTEKGLVSRLYSGI